MKSVNKSRARLGTALAALAIATCGIGASGAAAQPVGTYRPSNHVSLSQGEGQMVNLPRSVSSVWTSNPKVADIYVNGSKQINVFGKDAGEATVIATASDGSVVYGARVEVSPNLGSVNDVLRQAMPDSNISVVTVGQVAVMNGTVANPDDATQAQQLVRAMLNPGVKEGDPLIVTPINRLKVATPLQVTLKVKIAEVNRSVLKKMGVNLLATDPTSGFKFGLGQGDGIYLPPNSCATNCPPVSFIRPAIGTSLTGMGKLLGLDIMSSLDIAAQDGLVTVLAEPNLTAVSGETASFLAGGEFPIPLAAELGSISIVYKQYGVGLAFTPIVLGDGRISMRVRPEVSELSDEGSITLNGFKVPALTTRRAETTVELGSGQSFMIAGLLRNSSRNSVDKAPLLGDLPILGALFRSTEFRKDETELVIVVTPYLVRPVNTQMAFPTDGMRVSNDAQRDFLGQTMQGKTGAVQPRALSAPTATVQATGTAAAPGFKL